MALSINIQIIPNLEDGIVKRIEDAIGKDNGFVKNCVDILEFEFKYWQMAQIFGRENVLNVRG